MTNISKTTLRELKKRYLNVLKKCLLANLMVFSVVLPSIAEVTWDEYGNGYDSVIGTEENPADMTSSNTYVSFFGRTTYNDLNIELTNFKTKQAHLLYFEPNTNTPITIKNVFFKGNNIESLSTFRIISSNRNPFDPDSSITIKKIYSDVKNYGKKDNPSSELYVVVLDSCLQIVEEGIFSNFENIYANTIVGIVGHNKTDVSVPILEMNLKSSVMKEFRAVRNGWIGTNYGGTYDSTISGPVEKFAIKKIKLNIEDTQITYGHIYAIDGNLWGNGVKSSGDLVFDIGDIDISLKNTLVQASVRGIGSGTGTILGNPNIKIFIDKESVVKADVVGYYGWGYQAKDRYFAIGEIGDITLNIEGTANSIEGSHLYSTEKVNTENITINLNGATINKNVIGVYLEGTTDKAVETKDFAVNIFGDTIVKGSLKSTNQATSEILKIGETTLTVNENSSLIVGSVDEVTGEFKGEISSINKVNLKENSLLEAVINPTQVIVMSFNEIIPLNEKLFKANVSMEKNAKLRLRNNSNIDVLNSIGGTIDLSQTTPDATVTIQELEGEGTTFSVANAEVAQTTIGNNKSTGLTVKATGTLNDATNNPETLAETLSKVLTIQDGEKDLKLTAEEGKIASAMSADFKDGTIQNIITGTNGVSQSVADVMGLQVLSFRNQINDVQKRMGDLRLDKNTRGTWVRTFAGDVKYGNMGLKNKYNTIQAGVDMRTENIYLGVMASLTKGDSDMDRGNGEDKTYGMGIYAGYMDDNGWYMDVTAKQKHLQNKFKARYSTGEISRGSYKTWGSSVSVEGGKRWATSQGIFIEPQTEIMYGRVQGIGYTTSAGVKVEQEAFETLIGRAGVSIGQTYGTKGSVYINASVLNDFAGKTKTHFTYQGKSQTLREDMSGAWTEFAVGGTYKLNPCTYVYGELATSKGTDLTNPIQWSLGLRVAF